MIKAKENYRLWIKFTLIFFLLQLTTRLVLIFDRTPTFLETLDTMLDGFVWDLGTWAILSLPLMLYSLLVSDKIHQRLFNSPLNHLLTFAFTLVDLTGLKFQ